MTQTATHLADAHTLAAALRRAGAKVLGVDANSHMGVVTLANSWNVGVDETAIFNTRIRIERGRYTLGKVARLMVETGSKVSG